MIRRPPRSTLSLHDALPILEGALGEIPPAVALCAGGLAVEEIEAALRGPVDGRFITRDPAVEGRGPRDDRAFECRKDRKSTRLNSSHMSISYAVFCLKKKKT